MKAMQHPYLHQSNPQWTEQDANGLYRAISLTIESAFMYGVGLPFEVVQVQDENLRKTGLAILDATQRDIGTGAVSVDTDALSASLKALSATDTL